MGKKLDKKAKAAVAKAAKGVKAAKVDKAVKKFRKLEGKLWTREYLLKIAEFDGATIAPVNGATARADAMGPLAGEHHTTLMSRLLRTTSSVCVPMEPVDPRIAIFFMLYPSFPTVKTMPA